MMRIQARHIQVASPEEAQDVIDQWQQGANFEDLARSRSQCPTSVQGGNLGEFGPGHMPELDEVFTQGEPGQMYGPIATSMGFHLVEVIARKET